mgnify:CR=1 FL=1
MFLNDGLSARHLHQSIDERKGRSKTPRIMPRLQSGPEFYTREGQDIGCCSGTAVCTQLGVPRPQTRAFRAVRQAWRQSSTQCDQQKPTNPACGVISSQTNPQSLTPRPGTPSQTLRPVRAFRDASEGLASVLIFYLRQLLSASGRQQCQPWCSMSLKSEKWYA